MGRPRLKFLRTFLRYVFHVAAVLSTLVLVTCLFFWPRSYSRQENFLYQTPARLWYWETASGRLNIVMVDGVARFFGFTHVGPFKEAWSYASWHTDVKREGRDFRTEYHYLGLRLRQVTQVYEHPLTGTVLAIPFSYLTFLSVILPAVWLGGLCRRQVRRARPGLSGEPPPPSFPHRSPASAVQDDAAAIPLRFRLLRTGLRLAFHGAAGLSALVLVAGLIFWPRSYSRQESLLYQTRAGFWGLGTACGRVRLHVLDDAGDPVREGLHGVSSPGHSDEPRWLHTCFHTLPWTTWKEYHYLGLRLTQVTQASVPPIAATDLAIPFPYLTLPAALLPALELRRWLRRRRAARGRGFPVELPLPPTAAAR